MSSRFPARLYALARAAPTFLRPRRRPEAVERLLVAHHLLLGDTIMLTPLLKKARARFPQAEIVMTVPKAFAALYSGRPYGIKPLPFDRRSLADHSAMRRESGFDLALVPGDNRWAWLARALNARWIVAFASDRRTYKDVPVDEFVPMPQQPAAWGDIAARLIEGPEPAGYRVDEWPAPSFAPYAKPDAPYCVFHLGASSPHKLWPPERWRALVAWAESRGHRVALTVGPGEEALLASVDPEGVRSGLGGRLSLPQLWDLLQGASFLVCPDTGVAHVARLAGVPTVTLFGPGSPISSGAGRFWAASPFIPVWDPEIACRDQDQMFGRRVSWVRQCWRTEAECGNPRCIRRISIDHVLGAVRQLVPAIG